MGHHAGFEEKEYETLMNVSLVPAIQNLSGVPQLFSPGQALEKALGFDFSAYIDPTSRTYRLLFGQFHGPFLATPGVMGPPAPRLPARAPAVNIFLQYKRPEFFKATHRQPVWRRQPFLRFDVRSKSRTQGALVTDHSQLEVLDRLAVQRPQWLVRYACPSVWTGPDLYRSYAQGRLLDESCFVDPRHLRRTGGQWHNFWTFDPASPGVGQGNPDGDKIPVNSGREFFSKTTTANRERGSDFLSDLPGLKDAVSEVRRERRYFDQPAERIGNHRSKNYAITEAVSDLESALLSTPLTNDWLTKHSQQGSQPPQRVTAEDREVIEEALEVAATAAELGLTWIVQTA